MSIVLLRIACSSLFVVQYHYEKHDAWCRSYPRLYSQPLSYLHSTNFLQRLRIGRDHLRSSTPTTTVRAAAVLRIKHIALPHHHMVNIDLGSFEPATSLARRSHNGYLFGDLPLMRINHPPNQHPQHRPAPHQTRPIHRRRIKITPPQTRQAQNWDHQRREARTGNTNRVREFA